MSKISLERLKNLAFYAGLAILITGFLVIANQRNARQEEQRDLLMRIRNLDSHRLRTVELIPGHKPLASEVCLTVEDPVELKELADFFSRADDTDYGGHQSQQFRFKFYLGFVEKSKDKYLIRTYERFPNDIFLNVYSYEIYGDGSYSYSIDPQIRIPGLHSWLRDRVDRAGCPIE